MGRLGCAFGWGSENSILLLSGHDHVVYQTEYFVRAQQVYPKGITMGWLGCALGWDSGSYYLFFSEHSHVA